MFGNRATWTRILAVLLTPAFFALAQRPDILWMRGGHSSGIYQMHYSPDGQTLVSVGGETIKVWRVSDGMLLRTIRSPFTLFFSPGQIAISNDAQFVAVGGPTPSGAAVKLLRTDDAGAPPVWTVPLSPSTGLNFSPSGNVIAVGTINGPINILNAADGTQVWQIAKLDGGSGVFTLGAPTFSPDGSNIAACTSEFAHLVIFPVFGDGKSYLDFGPHTCAAGSLYWSPDGQYIAQRDALFPAGGACPVPAHGSCQPAPPVLSFASSGYYAYTAFAATGDFAHGIQESKQPDPVSLYHSPAPPFGTIEASNSQDTSGNTYLGSLAYSPDTLNPTLAIGLSTGLQLWNAQGGSISLQRDITVDWNAMQALAFSADGTLAATGSAQSTGLANVYDAKTGKLLQSIVGLNGSGLAPGVFSVHFTSDSQSLVADVGQQQANVFQLSNGSLQRSLPGIRCADLSPNGEYLSSGASLHLFSNGSLVAQGTGNVGSYCSRFSPNGQYLAVLGYPNVVNIYNVPAMSLKTSLTAPSAGLNAIAWSADSSMIAAGGYNNGNPPSVNVWKIDGSYSTTLLGSTGQIRAIAFSLDGGYLTAGGDDPVLRIWRISDGTVVQTYDQETGSSPAGSSNGGYNISSLTYSPDGSGILYGRQDATVVDIVNPVWQPPVSSVTAATPLAGGATEKGTVTLAGPAPVNTTVSLSSSRPKVAAVKASVTVLAGKTSAQFGILGGTVGLPTTATITAAANGLSASAGITVNPAGGVWLTGVSASPVSVTGGSPSTGTVTLNTAAPAGGVSVGLTSGNSAVTVPSAVTVAAGSTSATFPITTSAVAVKTTVPIRASYNGGTLAGGLVVKPPVLAAFALHPAVTVGGTTTTNNAVALNGPAPVGGVSVALSSDNAAVAKVPAMISIPEGARGATFSITTTAVTSATTVGITASYEGVSKAATLTVNK